MALIPAVSGGGCAV
ncbi:MAG: hypothetical protein ACE5KW_06380 [Dehalococcoidia bacterium]